MPLDDITLTAPPSGLWDTPFDTDVLCGVYFVAVPTDTATLHYVPYARHTGTGDEYRPGVTVCGLDGPYAEPDSYGRDAICPACADGMIQAIDEGRKALGAVGLLD